MFFFSKFKIYFLIKTFDCLQVGGGRGPPPPPATNRAAPAIPNRPGPGGAPQGRPGGALPPPLIPA